MDTHITTIDQFIAEFPEDTQLILLKIRETIHNTVPEAKEKIGYGIPTFTLNGRNLIHFSAYKKHIGLYPGAKVVEVFAKELEGYHTSKGTVQFPLYKPIPYDLIKKITKHCVQQEQAR